MEIIAYTGCLNKTWTYFENAITPSVMEETFQNYLWLLQIETFFWNEVLPSGGAAYRK